MTSSLHPAVKKVILSLLFFLLIAALFFVLFRADVGVKIPLVGWIMKSSKPELGIIALSILVSSILFILISKGVISEVPIIKIRIDPKLQRFRYIFSIPSPLLAILSIVSLAYILIIPPECASPNITFQVNLGEETKEYTPQSNVDVGLVSSVIVTIKSEESLEDMDCTFQANGDGLERFNSYSKNCSTTIFFQDKPSIIVLAANLHAKYCNNSTYFSITLHHQ